ncbi:hypothetical protein SLEP1_g36321 [Rubroshorea leprosula]|uniref:Uncharacterized protein n=1 Tax=Rubroshorea leprosula TaxID=152421 RepID=A0AAV5KRQ4_9ROSI|nr:hypothetical protein SLEP1_g36321 [Rubroshorea leprosula]
MYTYFLRGCGFLSRVSREPVYCTYRMRSLMITCFHNI